MSEVFLDLYRHHLWANLSLFEVCEPLPDMVLDATATGTYGSVRDTLVHLLAAEGRYLSAMKGESDFPGTEALKSLARTQGGQLLALAENAQSNEIIKVERGGQTYEIPISIFFAQAINHATEHRSHVCTILTQQGIEPPNLDVWSYLRSRAAG